MRTILDRSVDEILERARASGHEVLLEPEGLALLAAMGIHVPRHCFVRGSREAAALDLDALDSEKVVVKLVSPRILHRSDVGGIAFVPNDPRLVAAAIQKMERRFADEDVAGFLVSQFVPYDRSLGGELLLGARFTEEFGPVVTLGPGGIYTEFLSGSLREGRDVAILSPALAGPDRIDAAFEGKAIFPIVTGQIREQPPRISTRALRELAAKMLDFASSCMPDRVLELEINPLALTAEGPVALDVLVKLGRSMPALPAERPLWKLERLLKPRTIGIIGVSERMNPGHVILNNVIRDGFPRDRIHVIKPGLEMIEGCRCHPDVASLPDALDLLIVSIEASQVPALVEQVASSGKAESLIVIPGGVGERTGSEGLMDTMRATLARARICPGGGPLINGGNCLGIRSRPGRYDTLFIPEHKLPPPKETVSPIAIISQSGAFAVARASRLYGLNPKYLISVGNQTDLTVGDYLTYLKDDPELHVFACYVEGFRPMDGQRFLLAASEITASGRPVILYRAGRTPAGALATASHTASIAGDYAVTRELAEGAGVVVAHSLADFEELTRLFCFLEGKRVGGWNLGALSNAGFECVAIADNLGAFRLPRFSDETRRHLADLFRRCRLQEIVDVHNPLDLTPMMDDGAYEEAIRAVMADDQVDIGAIGCVPLTRVLNTLPASGEHGEDLHDERSIGRRLVRLKELLPKPWVVVIDGGPLYDPMAVMLQESGVPVFRTADRALRLLEIFCRERLARAGTWGVRARRHERGAPRGI